MAEQSYFQPGQRLDKYEVLRVIDRGKLADVYLALDPDRANAEVMVQVLRPQVSDDKGEEETRRRFQFAARQVSSLKHPNIVRIYDYGMTRGIYYIVMPLVEGPTLRDYLSERRSALPFELAMSIFKQVADAVAYAHERSIIHQDIRPAHILLEGGQRPLLADFGLSQIVMGDPTATPIASAGVPLYTSPEEASGQSISPQTDVYALGILLYEMMTGTVPFVGDSAARIMVKHLQAAPKPPSELNPTLDPKIDAVILKALAKKPEERFPTPGDMLEALVHEPDEARYDTVALDRESRQEFTARVRQQHAAIQQAKQAGQAQPGEAVTRVSALGGDVRDDVQRLRLWMLAGGLALIVIVLVVAVLLSGGTA